MLSQKCAKAEWNNWIGGTTLVQDTFAILRPSPVRTYLILLLNQRVRYFQNVRGSLIYILLNAVYQEKEVSIRKYPKQRSNLCSSPLSLHRQPETLNGRLLREIMARFLKIRTRGRKMCYNTDTIASNTWREYVRCRFQLKSWKEDCPWEKGRPSGFRESGILTSFSWKRSSP